MAKKFTNPMAIKLAEWLASNQGNAENLPQMGDGVSMGNLAQLGMGAAKAHPLSTGLGAVTTGSNIAGLFDNDKWGGQAAGLALGGLGSYLGGLNPGAAYLATTGAGTLGALFDKLRAKKAQENAQVQSYYQ